MDFEEFIGMMSKFRQLKTSNELEQELREIFNVNLGSFDSNIDLSKTNFPFISFVIKIFDKNADGFIDNLELKDVLTRLGESITDVRIKLNILSSK